MGRPPQRPASLLALLDCDMGCGSSTAKINEHKAALASAEFSGTLSWGGLASITGTLSAVKAGKGKAEVKDASGTVLLRAEYLTGEGTVVTDPTTGSAVVLIVNTQMGNLFMKKPTLWSVYTATATSSGQKPEATPAGAQMYRLGTFTSGFNPKKPMVYTDTSGEVVLSLKGFAGSACTLVNGPDGTMAAAVVEGVSLGFPLIGTCTFAKGVDPIMALAMSSAFLSISGGA